MIKFIIGLKKGEFIGIVLMCLLKVSNDDEQ